MMRSLVMAFVFGTVSAIAAPVLAQEGDAVAFDCSDGTALSVAFGEADATLTLADGSSQVLKLVEDGKTYHYSNGRYAITGEGDTLRFAVGKKAPVDCRMQAAGMAPFDEAVTVDEVPLDPDPANPDVERRITCYRYPDFAVKEVDFGEKGAQKLALIAKDGPCAIDDPAERIVPDLEGYFLGVKGPYVFFTYSDGWNGGMPFQAYEAASLKLLFEDNFAGDNIDAVTLDGNKLTLEFTRAYTAECSLYLDGGDCPAKVKAAVPGLGTAAPLPDCGPAYEAEKKRTPDYAKDIEMAPSVIIHKARLVWDGSKLGVEALAGETSCQMPT